MQNSYLNEWVLFWCFLNIFFFFFYSINSIRGYAYFAQLVSPMILAHSLVLKQHVEQSKAHTWMDDGKKGLAKYMNVMWTLRRT